MVFKLAGTGQHAHEIQQFIGLLRFFDVQSYLEIGSRDGGSLYTIAKYLPKGSVITSIDLPNSLWGNDKSKDNLTSVIGELNRIGYKANVIFGDSTSDEVISRVNSNYDAIFVDGDHTYQGVKKDYDNYFGKSSKVFAFHDIINSSHITKVEVYKLWNIIKEKHKTVEFIGDKSIMGIGAIIK